MRFNDFLFAAHGALMCTIIYSQFFPSVWGFKVGRTQRISRAVLGIFWGLVVSVMTVVLLVLWLGENGADDASGWAWIDVVSGPADVLASWANVPQIYALGYVKLTTVFLKYIPQAWVNYKRKSTVGWSIYPILLDFSGGWLSLAQLVIDSALQNDWTGLTGNPVKFGLGNITIVFDVIFFLQHYVFYRDSKTQRVDDEVDDGEWVPERERLVAEDDTELVR